MSDIRSQSDQELIELIGKEREVVRAERTKDKFSKNATVIRTGKQTVARALTELAARRNAATK